MANAPIPTTTDAAAEEFLCLSVAHGKELVTAVMTQAKAEGLLEGPEAQLSLGISRRLLEKAKRRTGLATDREVLEYALGNLALDDDFAEVFLRLGGVDPDLTLGY
jgi:hypothetical protein